MNSFFSLLNRHWRSLLVLNAAVVTAVTAVALITYKETWEAEATLVMPETTSKLDANLGALGSLRTDNPSFSQQVNPLKLQVSILQSDVVMERAMDVDLEKAEYNDVEDYKSLFNIEAEEQTTTIHLSTVGDEPEEAQQRLAVLIAVFEARLDELRISENKARVNFGEEKLDKAKTELDAARSQLAVFQRESGWVDTEVQTEELVKLISTLQEQVTQVEASALFSASQSATLSAQVGIDSSRAAGALGLDANPDYQLLRQELIQVVVALRQAQASYRDNHPQVQSLQRHRDQLEQQLQILISELALPLVGNPAITSGVEGREELIQQMLLSETQSSALQEQAARLRAEIDSFGQQLGLVPEARAELLSLQQQYDLAEGVYRGLLAQTQQSDISAFTAYPNVQTLDPPRADTEPVGPNLKLILANMVLAAIAGSGALLLLLEGQDPLVRPEDLRGMPFHFTARLPWIKSLGVPHLNGRAMPIDFQWLGAKLSAQISPGSYLLVTSAVEDEGKTTVALGLAEALSNQGYSVLAVDTNDPGYDLCRAFQQNPATVVQGQIVPIRARLDLMVYNELYRSQLSQILESVQACQNYDYVLIDSASMIESIGPLLINQFVDNVLFVVKQGFSRKRPVEKSLRQINRNRQGMLGLVINGGAAAAVEQSAPVRQPAAIEV